MTRRRRLRVSWVVQWYSPPLEAPTLFRRVSELMCDITRCYRGSRLRAAKCSIVLETHIRRTSALQVALLDVTGCQPQYDIIADTLLVATDDGSPELRLEELISPDVASRFGPALILSSLDKTVIVDDPISGGRPRAVFADGCRSRPDMASTTSQQGATDGPYLAALAAVPAPPSGALVATIVHAPRSALAEDIALTLSLSSSELCAPRSFFVGSHRVAAWFVCLPPLVHPPPPHGDFCVLENRRSGHFCVAAAVVSSPRFRNFFLIASSSRSLLCSGLAAIALRPARLLIFFSPPFPSSIILGTSRCSPSTAPSRSQSST